MLTLYVHLFVSIGYHALAWYAENIVISPNEKHQYFSESQTLSGNLNTVRILFPYYNIILTFWRRDQPYHAYQIFYQVTICCNVSRLMHLYVIIFIFRHMWGTYLLLSTHLDPSTSTEKRYNINMIKTVGYMTLKFNQDTYLI